MDKKGLIHFLFGCHATTRMENCPKHGSAVYSYHKLTGVNVCVECAFEDFQNRIENLVEIKILNCSKHGNVKHSYCSLTSLSICVECLKERRFYIDKEDK